MSGFTRPMAYPARLEDGEIVDAEGRRLYITQPKVVEIVNELWEWRMGKRTAAVPSTSDSRG